MTSPPLMSEGGQLEFLNKLQRILNEGLFTASYKYALVLALAELSVEKVTASDGSLAIPLHELSDRFITLYWRQTAPFAAGSMLQQNTGTQAAAIKKIAELRGHVPTLASARKHVQWRALVRDICQRRLNSDPLCYDFVGVNLTHPDRMVCAARHSLKQRVVSSSSQPSLSFVRLCVCL